VTTSPAHQQLADIRARIAQSEEKFYITDLSRRGLTRGLAEQDGDQVRARKNPDPIPGETYLIWTEHVDDDSPIFIATYCGNLEGEHLFATFAYVLQPGDEEVALDIRTTTSQHTIEDKVWVKARLGVVSLTQDQMDSSFNKVMELRRELATEEQWFSDFSEGLNELAEQHSWCGTYDEIVRAVGFPGREKDYWVEVEAQCTITDTNPSGRLDTLLEEHYGPSIVTSSVSFSGKITVKVTSITATTSDEAQNRVDRDDVKSALDELFSGDVELDDWEVKDSGEED
jgi:hypothetical protein